MELQKKGNTLGIAVLASYLIMIVVNALANILPINGVSTGAASDAYGNLFAPAGLTFSVWGVIYLLLAVHTLYYLGVFRMEQSAETKTLLRKTGVLFTVSSLANAAWIFAWHYDAILLSLLLMLVILVCLILIRLRIAKHTLNWKEKWLIQIPFSVYFGWITVATVANVTVLLVSLGWDGFGISEPVWTGIVLAVAVLIGTLTMLRFRDVAYGLVLIWAFSGILIKHISQSGFAGMYPAVITVIIGCIVLLAVALLWSLLPRNCLRGGGTETE